MAREVPEVGDGHAAIDAGPDPVALEDEAARRGVPAVDARAAHDLGLAVEVHVGDDGRCGAQACRARQEGAVGAGVDDRAEENLRVAVVVQIGERNGGRAAGPRRVGAAPEQPERPHGPVPCPGGHAAAEHRRHDLRLAVAVQVTGRESPPS